MTNLAGRPTTPAPSIGAFLAGHFHVIIPCLLLALYASPLINYQLPNTSDTLDESYEPLKTLKFAHSLGKSFHKWGPMPNFVYGPCYAVPLAYWKVHGDLGKVSTDYPYGLKNPFEQIGDLIRIARLAGLAVSCLCMAAYARALAGLSGSKLAACLAVTLCLATSPEFIFMSVTTKPDGMMLAFLAASMAAYASILDGGLTRRRGFFLSLMAVCSLSCKELTAPLFVPVYITIALRGLILPGEGPAPRRRFLVDFAFTVAAGVVAYLLIDVIYAPSSWRQRMELWLWGVGKDPAVWAPPGYTWSAYLLDAGRGALYNLGFGASAVALAALVSPLATVRDRLSLWVPSVGFAVIIILIAGYMPNYFLSPLNMTLALPVAAFLASVGGSEFWKRSRLARVSGVGAVALACLVNLWSANAAWVNAYSSPDFVRERFCQRELGRGELIHFGNMAPRSAGSSRLSYLGFQIDDRGVTDLVARPAVMPGAILIDSLSLTWIEEIKDRPARAAMLRAEGIDYQGFPGFEALGYRLDRVIDPRTGPGALFDFPVLRDIYSEEVPRLLVYRKTSP